MTLLSFIAAGPELRRFAVEPADATLQLVQSVSLPATAQYAVLHPSGHRLYVATGRPPEPTHVLVFTVDLLSGALAPHGEPTELPGRAIHIEIDPRGRHVFVSLLDLGTILVFGLMADGAIGLPVRQPVAPEAGAFLHQVRATPSGDTLLVCARGNDPEAQALEDPGAITRFTVAEGVLTRAGQIVMPPGVGPRHLDFSPDQRRVYVAVERGNTLRTYNLAHDILGRLPLFETTTLAQPDRAAPGQRAGAVHVHPYGRFVYVSNRGALTLDASGQQTFGGGENSIAAFALDPVNDEPRLIQQVKTHGLEPRSFGIDPSGCLLIVANQFAAANAPASLDVFDVGTDGRLEHKHAIPFEIDGFGWAGFAGCSAAPSRHREAGAGSEML